MKKRIRVKNFKYITMKKYDGMMGRCYRESDTSYKNYGLKGIKVCSSWISDINNFRKWAREELNRLEVSEAYFTKHSGNFNLDRINPNGHYSPNNCRFVDSQTNTRNRKLTKGKAILSAEGETFIFGDEK